MAVSRSVSRKGCYLYGKLRRTDFLPVGEEREDAVLECGWDSETSSDDSEHGLQYIGGLAGTEDESNVSSSCEKESDASSTARCGGVNPLAGSVSEEDTDLGQTMELDPDFQ